MSLYTFGCSLTDEFEKDYKKQANYFFKCIKSEY